MFPSCTWPCHGGVLLSLWVGEIWWYWMVGVQVNGLGYREDVPFFLKKTWNYSKACNSIHLFLTHKKLWWILQNVKFFVTVTSDCLVFSCLLWFVCLDSFQELEGCDERAKPLQLEVKIVPGSEALLWDKDKCQVLVILLCGQQYSSARPICVFLLVFGDQWDGDWEHVNLYSRRY